MSHARLAGCYLHLSFPFLRGRYPAKQRFALVHLATHIRHGVHVPDVSTAAHTLCRMALRSSAASGSPTLQFFSVSLVSFPHLRAPSRQGATSLPLAEFERVVLVEVEACTLRRVRAPLVCVPPADEVDCAILGRLKGYLALFWGLHGCGSVLVLASVLQQKACFPWS